MTSSIINLRSKKLLIELLMITALLVVASFLDWFSIVDESGNALYATGWSGSFYLYDLTIENWFVSINLILYATVLILRTIEFYQFKLRWFLVLLLPAAAHFLLSLYLSFRFENTDYEVGYYLLFIAWILLVNFSVRFKARMAVAS